MRNMLRTLMVLGAVTATVGLVPAAASADTVTGRDYGGHVVHCAQTMGFSGEHNPGMHHGYAGFAEMEHKC